MIHTFSQRSLTVRASLIRLSIGLACLGLASQASAQSTNLNTVSKTGTIAANGEYVEFTTATIGGLGGGFGSVKVQTKDSYSGTWEVQCSVDGSLAGYDASSELKLTQTDGTSVIYEVTDTVAIWDVGNASGCQSIRVIATAGFAASNVEIAITATQSGGSSGGGGGSLGEVEVDIVGFATEAKQDSTILLLDGVETLLGTNTTAVEAVTAAIDSKFGTAGSADSNVGTIQGISGMTPILATVSDGSGALNVIIDSAPTLTVSATNLDVQSGGVDLATQATSANTYNALVAWAAPGTPDTATATSSLMIAGVYNSTPPTFTDTEQGPLQLDANGFVKVNVAAGSSAGPSDTSDTSVATGQTAGLGIALNYGLNGAGSAWVPITAAADWTVGTAVGTTGPGGLAVYSEFDGAALPTITNVDTEGEAVPVAATLKGVQYFMLVTEDGALTPLVTEDLGETTSNALMGVGAVARSTVVGSTSTNGDNATFNVDLAGRLLTAGAVIEDVGEAGAETLVAMAAVVRATAVGSSATANDFATLNVDTLGRLWTRDGDPCSDPARITSAAISASGAATAEVVALNGSDLIYVCSYKWVTTLANSLNWIAGTGSNCASSQTTFEGAQPYGATGGIAEGGGGHTLFVVPAGKALCLVSSTATAHGGRVSYVRTAAP